MYKLFIFFTVVLLLSCQQETSKSFEISGHVKNATDKHVALISFGSSNKSIILDTTLINQNETFSLHTISKIEELFAVQFSDGRKIWVINDSPKISLEYNPNSYKDYHIKGSPKSILLHNFIKELDSLVEEKDSINKLIDSLKLQKNVDSLLQTTKDKQVYIKEKAHDFCVLKINSSNSPALSYFFIYYAFVSKCIEPYEANSFAEIAYKKYVDNTQILGLKNYFDKQAQNNPKDYIVNKALDSFSYLNSDSQKVTLSTFKNKALLINFWKTKSLECVKQNDNLKNLYNTYQPYGFDILSIDLDSNITSWKKLVAKDSLVWNNVIDTLGVNCKLCRSFFVDKVPYNILINRDGKIEAINIEFDDVKQRLRKRFK